MRIPFIDLARAYEEIAPELDACLHEVARSGAYVLGDHVRALEEAVASYLSVNFTVAVGSGTDALYFALTGLDIGPGDEVITTPFTFAATVEAIEYLGAQPVLVDIDPLTLNIDAKQVVAAITTKTRCILPVHLFGLPADMRRISEVAENCGIGLVEDCAQSFGATLDGKATGSFGGAGAFSFYPTKNLGSLGDGGLVSMNDPTVDRRLRQLRNHGIGDDGEHITLGFNSRLDEIQAAILRIKLARIEEFNQRRRDIAARYNEALSGTGVVVPNPARNAQHVYGYYTILADDRDKLRARLDDAGIATALYYRKPLHQHMHFANTCRFASLKFAEQAAQRCLSLPIFPELTDDEVDYVASTTAALLS